jgi:hypothetical protein
MRVESRPFTTRVLPGPQRARRPRSTWRAVAVPSEHGGWGLTLEPALLGLLLMWSWAGLAVAAAAVLGFLLRTPLKLALVDRRRGRSLPRTRVAWRIAALELASIVMLTTAAGVEAGWAWLVPVVAALPLFAIELWYDVRSRSRRLLPELCGAVGITAVTAAIVIIGGGRWSLAIAGAMILAGRAVASVPFVRTQIVRLRRQPTSLTGTDGFQVAGIVVALAAAAADPRVLSGAGAVVAVAAVQFLWLRRPVPPAKVLGLWQMAFGLAVVTATGAHLFD